MRRNALTLLASLFLVFTLTGCSLFGGKKKDAMTEDYNPAAEPPVTQPTNYNAFPTTGGYAGGSTSGSKYHTVQKKDTLYSLARQYYNDQHRWKDIYEANRSEIGDPNKIRVGQRLVIP